MSLSPLIQRVILLAISLLLVASWPAEAVADEIRFMRDPHIGHGMVVFSYHGDIWIANQDGLNGRRLTTHVAREIAPRFSPDGRWVAFTSDRFGNNDVFIVSIDGGEPTQLTFHTGSDVVGGWSPDSRSVLFVTSRHTHPFYSPMYMVPVTGGIPTPMAMDQGRSAMINPAGTMVAFNRRAVSTTRKGYRGNNSTEIFVQDLSSGEITQLTDTNLEDFREHVHDAIPMWGVDGMIYHVSERDGIFNVWRISPQGGTATQVTHFSTGGTKYPSISDDGRTIIFTQEHELWTLDLPDGRPQKLTIDMDFEPTTNLIEWIEVESRVEGFGPSPAGDFVAVDFRGEIFLVPTDLETGEKTRVTTSPWRERYAEFSPDGTQLAYVSDESLEEELWVHSLKDGSKQKLSSHESQKTRNFVWSPDGSRIAYVAANRLFEVDVASGRSTELGYNIARGYTLSQYSAEGDWLLYDRRDEEQGQDVYLFDIATREEHDVTANPFRDSQGTLTPTGEHLVFRSDRDGGTSHLFITHLATLTEDPSDPLVKARKAEQDQEAEPGPLQVDTDGIEQRAVQLTTGEYGVGTYFLSADGETLYFTSRDDDGPGLFSIGINGEGRKKVSDGTFDGIRRTRNGEAAFFIQNAQGAGSELHKMELPSGSHERVTFSYSVQVEHRAEWEQIFEESWRVMKYRFYDENMHGKDWAAIKADYKPLLPHVGSYEDVYDLANQMIGELNASHVGVRGGPSRPQEGAYQTRFLGFELEPGGDRYQVSHVYRDGPADKEWLDIKVGDFVLALDGQVVHTGDNYWEILNHTLNEFVPVQVADESSGSGSRELRIRPVTSLNNIKYEEWVAKNREFVERESDGRIAYVHIRSMNQPSLRRFENEINQFWNARGIVVDIRYNGGGNIDQQLIDILERRPYEFWNSRWDARTSGRRPRQAIAGPKVMLVNNRSGSDSEVTPMGFRDLGLGRIVGNPTGAAVIATGSYGLIHGGTIRTPGSLVVTWDPTKPNNYGINLENYGVAPDVFVENTPNDELAGFDRELKEAVDEALRMLAEGGWRFVAPPESGGVRNGRGIGGVR